MLNDSSQRPIIQIEDDLDDQFLVQQALYELKIPNPVRFFQNGQEGLDYLRTTQEQPLLILCDINMPLMNGLELRSLIDADEHLRAKCIPFVFFTTSATHELVVEAYRGTIQGFHQKETQFESLKHQLSLIISYWKTCLHPNSF